MNAITNAYNYYMSAYASKQSRNRYGAHKQSELKDIYQSIVKINKESPLYLYDRSQSVFHYAVNLKEEALGLKSALTALTNESDPNSILGRKIAKSDNPEAVSVEYIGNHTDQDGDSSHELQVNQLATPQINTGKYLPQQQLRLMPGDYSFEVRTNAAAYEFQFHVSHNDTNLSLQNRLANLINNSNIGIKAETLTDDENATSAIQLISENTGRKDENDTFSTIFKIENSSSESASDIVNYLDLQHTSQFPENALFTLDGKEHSSSSNVFTINHTFEVHLNETTKEAVEIGFKADTDTIAENIKTLANQYNSMIETSSNYTPSKKVQSHFLPYELNKLTAQFHNSLEAIGLDIDSQGKIQIDDSLLYQSLDEDSDDTVQSILSFKSALINKTDQVLINPMEYVDRTIVAYKNPGKTFANPYITSIYSGMLFNSYC